MEDLSFSLSLSLQSTFRINTYIREKGTEEERQKERDTNGPAIRANKEDLVREPGERGP